jgi:hypothetical protein
MISSENLTITTHHQRIFLGQNFEILIHLCLLLAVVILYFLNNSTVLYSGSGMADGMASDAKLNMDRLNVEKAKVEPAQFLFHHAISRVFLL